LGLLARILGALTRRLRAAGRLRCDGRGRAVHRMIRVEAAR
jgi:hypothetical protein